MPPASVNGGLGELKSTSMILEETVRCEVWHRDCKPSAGSARGSAVLYLRQRAPSPACRGRRSLTMCTLRDGRRVLPQPS